MEDASGIPEDLRCKRSDGKQWRCSALSMPDKTVCEKHYIQAKRRAANSAMRASEKKARRKLLAAAGGVSLDDAYLETPGRGGDDRDASVSPADGGVGSSGGGGEFSGGRSPAKKHKGRMRKGRGWDRVGVKGSVSPLGRHWEGAQRDSLNDGRIRSAYAASQDYSGRSTDSSGEVEGLTCHQCQRNDKAGVVWCMSCSKRGYCESCVFRRYPNISIEDIRRVCPACRGICNCRVCVFGDNLIKGRIREMASIDKLQQLHRLLSFLLPVLKQIHAEQCYELELEIRAYGMKSDIPRAKLHPDEQMCCDFCKIPILDYHRHCMNCLYDLCLSCCRDLRRASSLCSKGESEECQTVDQNLCGEQLLSEHPDMRRFHYTQKYFIDEYAVDFTSLFPKWKVNSDNSISCPPSEHGACGKSPLVLRRILKINWVAKLVKNAEEMVNGCKTSDFRSASCIDCAGNNSSQSSHSTSLMLYKTSKGEDSDDNFLYSPTLQDIEQDNIGHFHKHWVNGEPVVIRHVFEPSLSACWDPMSIWRGIQEITDDEANDDMVVRVMNCFDQSEVNIELREFIKGYMDGKMNSDGHPAMLRLKDWPPTNAVEEFLLCQRPEFLSKLPLLEYFHCKWGLLNLAAKLPCDSMQNDFGPKILMTYGRHKEFSGVSMPNCQVNMGDAVYLLMHTSETKYQDQRRGKLGNIWKDNDGSENKELAKDEKINPSSSTNVYCRKNRLWGISLNEGGIEVGNEACTRSGVSGQKETDFFRRDKSTHSLRGKGDAGATWDVFRRQDVPKLNEYLRTHLYELKNADVSQTDMVKIPIYEQGLSLNGFHKKKLRDEFGVEPWTFQQCIGEAVFVPAGCPFQVWSCQSTVQLRLDFLSPESLAESFRMAQEIRCLPSYHEAKLQMLEVGKMCLYGASSAIRDIQKIVLDPKLSSQIMLEDRNMTAAVSENLERMAKRNQVACI